MDTMQTLDAVNVAYQTINSFQVVSQAAGHSANLAYVATGAILAPLILIRALLRW